VATTSPSSFRPGLTAQNNLKQLHNHHRREDMLFTAAPHAARAMSTDGESGRCSLAFADDSVHAVKARRQRACASRAQAWRAPDGEI